jgi:hypothetical protein
LGTWCDNSGFGEFDSGVGSVEFRCEDDHLGLASCDMGTSKVRLGKARYLPVVGTERDPAPNSYSITAKVRRMLSHPRKLRAFRMRHRA